MLEEIGMEKLELKKFSLEVRIDPRYPDVTLVSVPFMTLEFRRGAEGKPIYVGCTREPDAPLRPDKYTRDMAEKAVVEFLNKTSQKRHPEKVG